MLYSCILHIYINTQATNHKEKLDFIAFEFRRIAIQD